MLHIKKLLATVAGVAVMLVLSFVFLPASHASAADLYPYGQCTYYAKLMRPDVGNFWGNAKYWAASARAAGFPVSKTPRVGDVAVFQAYVQGNSHYGHVGIVIAVQGSRFELKSMWGNEATGRIHVTWHYTGGGVSFIHYRGSTALTSYTTAAHKATSARAKSTTSAKAKSHAATSSKTKTAATGTHKAAPVHHATTATHHATTTATHHATTTATHHATTTATHHATTTATHHSSTHNP